MDREARGSVRRLHGPRAEGAGGMAGEGEER